MLSIYHFDDSGPDRTYIFILNNFSSFEPFFYQGILFILFYFIKKIWFYFLFIIIIFFFIILSSLFFFGFFVFYFCYIKIYKYLVKEKQSMAQRYSTKKCLVMYFTNINLLYALEQQIPS